MREIGDGIVDIARRWADAWERGDIDAIVAMLTAGPMQDRWQFRATAANGQLTFGTYRWDDAASAYLPGGLDVLTIRDRHVTDVTSFLTANLVRFGLPARIDG